MILRSMDKEIITGNRITLRPITEADTKMVLEWRNSDRTVRNFYYRKPVTEEDHKKWLSSKVDTGEVWQYIVSLKDGDVPIGCVYVQHIDVRTMSGESGLFFSEDAPSGEGYGTEALVLFSEEVCFKKLGLLRLYAKVQSENEASRHLHEHAGYKTYKTVPKERCSDGEEVTSIYYKKGVPFYEVPGTDGSGRRPIIRACTGKIELKTQASDKKSVLEIKVPGSKSITNRALLTAMLATGMSRLSGVLFSDDTESFLNCMESLGIETEIDREAQTVTVHGCGGDIPNKSAHLGVGSAGTAARFLTAVLGLSHSGEYHLDSSDQMKKRPMKPLLDALAEMGCEVEYEGEEGFFPFVLKPHGFVKKEAFVDIDKSSQFLSALLIAAPLSDEEITINVTGSHGLSYVEMTGKIMRSFGAVCESMSAVPGGVSSKVYSVKPGGYSCTDYEIEPDASAACYFAALSPLIKKQIILCGLHKTSMQGDTSFIGILEDLGIISSVDTPAGIGVIPVPKDIHASGSGDVFETVVDMSGCSDQTITLSAIAPILDRKIRITGISHIRLQESDRISAIVSELKKLGVDAAEDGDDILISPGFESGQTAKVSTYNDHRMAMGFSLTGLIRSGVVIEDPLCCDKTFPDYFAYLDEIMSLA